MHAHFHNTLGLCITYVHEHRTPIQKIINIVKTLTRLEIILFILNNHFVLQTLLSSNNSPFAAITALQTFGIIAVNLLR